MLLLRQTHCIYIIFRIISISQSRKQSYQSKNGQVDLVYLKWKYLISIERYATHKYKQNFISLYIFMVSSRWRNVLLVGKLFSSCRRNECVEKENK